ncbi:MAG: universal stress protein [Sedimenticola sp.]
MSTETRSVLGRFLQGSISLPIIRTTCCNTLLLPNGHQGFIDPENGKASLRKILLCIDHDPDPREANTQVTSLSRLVDGDDSLEAIVLYVGEAADTPHVELSSSDRIIWNRAYGQGKVVKAICEEAEEIDADVIVMPTAGHQGLMDSLRGSTTEQVLAAANRPLLAVPSG